MNVLLVVLMSSVLTQQISWTTKTPLPQALAGSGCAVVNDTIFVIGGRDSVGNRYATNYIYDPVGDSWSTRANMSTPRAHLACAYVNGKIYAIGGWGNSGATNVVEEYDPFTDSWTTMTPMPTSRYCYGLVVYNDKIYIIGGMVPIMGTVEVYGPAADTGGGTPWETRTTMPTPRMGPGSVELNDTFYVYGGCTVIGVQVTTVNQAYDPLGDSWTSKANMFNGRYCHGYFSYDGYAYAVGGYSLSTYFNSIEVYDPFLNIWSYENPMQYARQSVAVGLVGNKVYVIGGWNNGALNYNEEGTFPVGIAEPEDRVQKSEISITASPNPFSSSTTLSLRAASEYRGIGVPEIHIYDLSGRMVREISLPTAYSLLHTGVTWDGRDEAGKILPGGTYIVRVTGKGWERSRQITIVR